ncbi:hypothetical protein LUZ60_011561 [Juncus effusus]|nr:hypothetical protein LUZ60_011561 [Juncus effusus]
MDNCYTLHPELAPWNKKKKSKSYSNDSSNSVESDSDSELDMMNVIFMALDNVDEVCEQAIQEMLRKQGRLPLPPSLPTTSSLTTTSLDYFLDMSHEFRWANYSSDYVSSGKGSLKFQLINQSEDFAIALFTVGMSKPVLVAVSNTISFINPKAPVYPRLALGKSWNEMTVTWTSGYDISEAVPFVEWGAPARTVGWRDPGHIHTGFFNELWPNKMYDLLTFFLWYYYKVGHELSNGSIVWGKPSSFKAPPFPGQNSLQRLVIFGDMGKGERDGSNEYYSTQPGSLNTTDTITKDLDNIDAVFHIGDITYANGYLSEWDQFSAQIEPISSRVPYMLDSGNHERDWPDSGSFYDVQDSGGECGVVSETMFYVPAENRAKYWYAVDYGMFRFCIGDTEHDWRQGSEQHKFLEKCFASVDRKHQPWLIFAAHRVVGYSSSPDYIDEGLSGEPMGRESLQLLW